MQVKLSPPAPFALRISPDIVAAIRNLEYGVHKKSTSQAVAFLLFHYLESIAQTKRMTPECKKVYDIMTGKAQEDYDRTLGIPPQIIHPTNQTGRPVPPRYASAQPAPAPRRTMPPRIVDNTAINSRPDYEDYSDSDPFDN